jgi:hypothetical protein
MKNEEYEENNQGMGKGFVFGGICYPVKYARVVFVKRYLSRSQRSSSRRWPRLHLR